MSYQKIIDLQKDIINSYEAVAMLNMKKRTSIILIKSYTLLVGISAMKKRLKTLENELLAFQKKADL